MTCAAKLPRLTRFVDPNAARATIEICYYPCDVTVSSHRSVRSPTTQIKDVTDDDRCLLSYSWVVKKVTVDLR